MIHNIREAFNELLKENDWMDRETRKVAEEKVDNSLYGLKHELIQQLMGSCAVVYQKRRGETT